MPGRPDWSYNNNMCIRHARDQSNRINYPGARYNSARTDTLDWQSCHPRGFRQPVMGGGGGVGGGG